MKRLCILLPLVLLLSACEFSLAADVTPPPGYQPAPELETTAEVTAGPMFPVVPPDPAQGGLIYTEKCAPCHGVNGMGDGPNAASLPNPVTALGNPDVARQASPERWFDVVTNGNLDRFMPPFRSLSDRERWDVVAYALTLSVDDAGQARAAEIYAGECSACHGPSGSGGSQAAGAVPALNDQERMAGRAGADLFAVITGGGDRMPAYAQQLSDAERWALADYVRLMTFANTAGPQAAAQPGVQDTAQPPAAGGADADATEIAEALPGIAVTQAVAGALPLGVVSGAVTTASGDPAPAGLTVNLHAFEGMTLAYTSTTTLQGDGAYVFENLDMPAGMAYLTTVEFSGVLYGSDVVVADDPAQPLDLPIQVFETTIDTSALSVDRLHYFFEPVDEDTLRVLELYVISNSGDKTVRAEKTGDPVLSFTLPDGAQNLQFEDGALGDRYKETPGGFGDTIPVRPGSGAYQVLFSYELPFKRKLELTRTTPLNTQAVVILAPEDTLTIRGDDLKDAGARDMQGVQYHMYNAPMMPPGGQLALIIGARGRGLRLASTSTANLVIGLSALGITLLAAGGWLYSRTRRSGAPDAAADGAAAVPAANLDSRDAVMDAILALDDLYQEGKLPEDAYLERRAELKARLQSLMGD